MLAASRLCATSSLASVLLLCDPAPRAGLPRMHQPHTPDGIRVAQKATFTKEEVDAHLAQLGRTEPVTPSRRSEMPEGKRPSWFHAPAPGGEHTRFAELKESLAATGQVSAVEIIRDSLSDSSIKVRRAAIVGLGTLKKGGAKEALRARVESEKDEELQSLINKTLKKM